MAAPSQAKAATSRTIPPQRSERLGLEQFTNMILSLDWSCPARLDTLCPLTSGGPDPLGARSTTTWVGGRRPIRAHPWPSVAILVDRLPLCDLDLVGRHACTVSGHLPKKLRHGTNSRHAIGEPHVVILSRYPLCSGSHDHWEHEPSTGFADSRGRVSCDELPLHHPVSELRNKVFAAISGRRVITAVKARIPQGRVAVRRQQDPVEHHGGIEIGDRSAIHADRLATHERLYA